MKYTLLAMLVLMTIFTGCKKEDNPVGPDESADFIYPLQVGNKWEYIRTFKSFNFRPDSLTNYQQNDTTITDTAKLEIIKTAILRDSIETFFIQETLKENENTYIDDTYYANHEDGLYFYAYRGPGFVIPKVSLHRKILFKDRYFNSIREMTSFITRAIPQNYILADTIIYEIPPLQSLKYPFKIGAQWTYRPPKRPWQIDKKVLSYEKIKVVAGSYYCYKIQWLYDMDHNGKWDDDIIFYDWVSRRGLVKRSILFKDEIITIESGPEPLGKMDSLDESILTMVQYRK